MTDYTYTGNLATLARIANNISDAQKTDTINQVRAHLRDISFDWSTLPCKFEFAGCGLSGDRYVNTYHSIGQAEPTNTFVYSITTHRVRCVF